MHKYCNINTYIYIYTYAYKQTYVFIDILFYIYVKRFFNKKKKEKIRMDIQAFI